MSGRPKKAQDTFEQVYQDCKEGKISAAKGAKKLGIARSTWYRKVRELEQEGIDGGAVIELGCPLPSHQT